MNLSLLSDQELVNLKDQLQRELSRLRASVKNYNTTIRNIIEDMRTYRLQHGIIVENPQEIPRA